MTSKEWDAMIEEFKKERKVNPCKNCYFENQPPTEQYPCDKCVCETNFTKDNWVPSLEAIKNKVIKNDKD